MSRKTGGIVVLFLLLGLSAMLLNCGSSSSRPSGVLFVTSEGANIVQSYAINLGNGDLSQLNTSATTCTTAPCGPPLSIVLDPSKANIFVLNQGAPLASPVVAPSIYGYTAKSDGSLSGAGDVSTSLGVFTQGDTAVAMARDAAGKFLFVVTAGNQNPGSILPPQLIVFGTQPGSTSLTAIGLPIPLTRIPTAVAAITFTPTNGSPQTLLYVTSTQDLIAHNDNTVSEYSVGASGNVTEELGSPYTTGTVPMAVLALFTQANNLFVYTANSQPDNNINAFAVCTILSSSCSQGDVTNAKMTPVGSPVPVGLSPRDMITDATRSFLYVANSGSNNVASFRVNPSSGALSGLNPQTVSTGAIPVALALHPNGEFLYVANSGAANGEGSVSGFNVNLTSGSLSGGIQINSAAQPAGVVAK